MTMRKDKSFLVVYGETVFISQKQKMTFKKVGGYFYFSVFRKRWMKKHENYFIKTCSI